ncbi:MAG: helix-turn-helix transcriptional regulator, partial [Clostridia bacterium]|nr:helix-turn-helix transcriptional regulator [Clostridia bacterium]
GLSDAFERLHEEHSMKKYGHDIACIAILSQILTTLLRETEGESPLPTVSEDIKRRIYSSTIFLRRNFMYDVSEEICAKQASLSRYYFSRNFKAVTGRTFREYLNLVRIEHANVLLTTTEKSISEIASLCGFGSVSHFIYTYKKSQNITPLAFRHKNKR